MGELCTANLGISVFTKMTRSKSRTSFPPAALPCPWLMFCHGQSSKTQTFYNASNASFCVKRIPDISGKKICASFHEWMVMVDRYSSNCFLLNIISLEKVDLPPWEDMPYQFWILSAPLTDDNCIVGFIGEDSHSVTFCRPGDGKWVEHTFELENGTLRGYTICKGEIYCHGLQHGQANLVILDIVDHRVKVRHVLRGRPDSPVVPELFGSASYFIESCEEIFLVQMFMLGESTRKIQDIAIFKLDLSSLEWVNVESIGDRTFFINKATNCISCSATKSGTLGNSIYFTQYDNESMYVFDVEEKCIHAHYPCPYLGHNVAHKQWTIPVRT